MSFVIDLIVILIIAVTAFISAKRGFVRVIIELAGFIAAVYLTFALSAPLANITYDKFIGPSVVSSVTTASGDTAEDIVESTWNALPGLIKNNANSIGLSKESFSQKISGSMAEGAATAAQTASQSVVRPVVTKILSLLYSVILMIVLMFVVRLLARFLNKLFSFSIVGKLNRALGGVIGIFKGLVIALVFCMAVSLIVSFTANGILIFTKDNINGTTIFKYLSSFSPFK